MNSYTLGIVKVLTIFVIFMGVVVPSSAYADLWYDGGYDGGYWGDGGYDGGALWDDGGYDGGYWGDYGYDSGYWGDYGYDGYDAGYYGYDAGYNGYDAGYYGYDAGYDYYTPSYSYGGGYDYDYGCGSYCGGSYGGGNYGMGYSTWVPSVSTPVRSTGGSSSYYNSNTVTNTNVNNVTNIDNSIRDSFNNYNSGNTSIVVATPQVPVVQTYPAPYCTINHALAGGSYNYGNNSAYLSWSSTNATSAYLSNVGSVETSGSRTVYPGHTTTYTLTVYGSNGTSATCSTTVQGYTYTPPVQPPVYIPPVVQQPYVSLTQIPYTGFDLGPIGNALYWAALIAFAFAGSYLMIYYRGGAFAFAGAMLPKRTQKPLPAVVAPKAPILVEKEALATHESSQTALIEARVAPIVASLRKAAGTNDSMAIVKANDGSMPRIVINRS